jgi:hypothetical protein
MSEGRRGERNDFLQTVHAQCVSEGAGAAQSSTKEALSSLEQLRCMHQFCMTKSSACRNALRLVQCRVQFTRRKPVKNLYSLSKRHLLNAKL